MIRRSLLAVCTLWLSSLAAFASAQSLPDLVPEVSDVHFVYGTSVSPGDVAEGCATATEGLDLLRLALTTRNDGPGDLTFGDPRCPFCASYPGAACADSRFICSPAGGHGHPHYGNFLRYELIDSHGAQVGIGGKRSFCLAESGCIGPSLRHTCTNQGLYAGCWDIYPSYLGCQYIEITDVPSGTYALRVTVDPGSEIDEADETNNVIEQAVEIRRDSDWEVMLGGGSLVIVPERLLRLHSERIARDSPSSPESDPTIEGAVLRVVDLEHHGELEIALPRKGWKRLGLETPFGYRYRGAGSDADPCHSVVITTTSVRANCLGRAIGLELPARGGIFVQLAIGDGGQRFCATFGGKTLLNSSRVLLRHDPPASTCSAFH